MSAERASVTRSTRRCVYLVIVVLLVLPTLVRATRHFTPATDSSPIRLNRGFDLPPGKSTLAAPVSVGEPVTIDDTPHVWVRSSASPTLETLPASPVEQQPDVQRGPPTLLLSCS